MLKLPESARERKRSFGGAAVSTLVHVSLIGGAVLGGSAIPTKVPHTGVFVTRVVYVEDKPRPIEPTPPVIQPPSIPTNVRPTEVPAIPDLRLIPTGLPPEASRIGTMSLDSFATAPVVVATVTAGPGSNEPYLEMAVEKAVMPLQGNPSPRYPAMLAASGAEGVVQAQFVVDTTGRIEEGSIRILRADHALFERAVRDAMRRMRFSPAEVGQRKVRQLVEQGFSFAIQRR